VELLERVVDRTVAPVFSAMRSEKGVRPCDRTAWWRTISRAPRPVKAGRSDRLGHPVIRTNGVGPPTSPRVRGIRDWNSRTARRAGQGSARSDPLVAMLGPSTTTRYMHFRSPTPGGRLRGDSGLTACGSTARRPPRPVRPLGELLPSQGRSVTTRRGASSTSPFEAFGGVRAGQRTGCRRLHSALAQRHQLR